MPKASKNERKKRRVKRTNSLLKRQLRGLSLEANKAYLALITILAQKGGEITVTRGTMQQAANDLLNLGFSVGPGADEQELIIRLVTNSPVGEASPAGDIEVDESDIVPVEEESDALPPMKLENGSTINFSPDDNEQPFKGTDHAYIAYDDVDGNIAETIDTSNNPTLGETFNALIAAHDGSTPVVDPSVEQD